LDRVLAEAAQGEVVTAANLNSPDQIVISGSKGAVERAIALAKQAGCKRAVLLPVSAPFHSPLMAPAQERMKVELDQATFRDLQIPLINNVDAREVRSGSEAREGLVRQVSSPVRWTETVRLLTRLGVTQAIEVGPGGVLGGLIRSIEPGIATAKFGEAEDLENLPAA
jgi:[acyl-carrier-protein] S-malonyltransferase